MSAASPRISRRRTISIAVVSVVALIAVGSWQYAPLRARHHASRLADAPVERRELVRSDLAAMGHHAIAPLLDLLTRNDDALCEIVGDILRDVIEALPEDRRIEAVPVVCEAFSKSSPGGQAAILTLAVCLASKCECAVEPARRIAAIGLKAASPAVRAAGVRLTGKLGDGSEAEIAALLADESFLVRRAALLALGNIADNPTTGPDEFFRLLHDTDAENRRLTESILRGRGLRIADIALARRFTHPDPVERLRLLVDVASDDGINTASLLDRLSGDGIAAVRVAAVRSAAENGIDLGDRIRTMSRDDRSESVRWIAGHYGRWIDETK